MYCSPVAHQASIHILPVVAAHQASDISLNTHLKLGQERHPPVTFRYLATTKVPPPHDVQIIVKVSVPKLDKITGCWRLLSIS